MRPVVSIPTAWSELLADGDIRTNFHAGGITSRRIRSSAASSFICLPFSSRYLKPRDFEPFRFHHLARRPFSTIAKSRALDAIVMSVTTCPSMHVEPSIRNKIEFKKLLICATLTAVIKELISTKKPMICELIDNVFHR